MEKTKNIIPFSRCFVNTSELYFSVVASTSVSIVTAQQRFFADQEMVKRHPFRVLFLLVEINLLFSLDLLTFLYYTVQSVHV